MVIEDDIYRHINSNLDTITLSGIAVEMLVELLSGKVSVESMKDRVLNTRLEGDSNEVTRIF